jgi:hypothetical protein
MSALVDHDIVWDWDEHKAAGKLGGDDFLTHRREPIEAPVAGRLSMAGSTASIRQADGWRTVLLELGELVGARSRDVAKGDVIAKAGKLWVHAHDLAPGAPATVHTRSRWIAPTKPAGGEGTPIQPDQAKEPTMIITKNVRKGVGEYYMFSTASTVSLSPELSTLNADDRRFWDGVAAELAREAGIVITEYDDTPNGGWFMRDQLALRVAGMPAGFPLTPDKPWHVGGGTAASIDYAALAKAVNDDAAARMAN